MNIIMKSSKIIFKTINWVEADEPTITTGKSIADGQIVDGGVTSVYSVDIEQATKLKTKFGFISSSSGQRALGYRFLSSDGTVIAFNKTPATYNGEWCVIDVPAAARKFEVTVIVATNYGYEKFDYEGVFYY